MSIVSWSDSRGNPVGARVREHVYN